MPLSPYQLIDTPHKLSAVVKKLADVKALAVDLEADSMFHYQEKVCLLQLAANGDTYLVDPLMVKDLSALKNIFANPNLTKIFHGADYDIRSLYRDFRLEVTALFDTELACRFLGYHPSGLATVLNDRYGVTMDKRFQRKNWAKRPLPEEMLAYAAGDVAYLLPLANALKEELEAKKRLAWVTEECEWLSRVRAPEKNGDPLYLRFKGAGTLDRRSLSVLEAVLQARDAIAAQKDRPPYKVLDKQNVMALVNTKPTTLKAMARTGALSARQIELWGKQLVKALKMALALAEKELPRYPRTRSARPPEKLTRRISALKNWRKKCARQLDLEPGLLINNALITAIATLKPSQRSDFKAIEGLRNWQIVTFGDEITALLAKLK